MAVLRGGYVGGRVHSVRFRAERDLYEELLKLAQEKESTMARVVRDLIIRALSDEHWKSSQAKRTR
jgi:hypothetical protein